MKPCSIIDVPSDLGLRRTGVDGLPDALRAAGLLEELTDVPYAGRVSVPSYVSLRDESTMFTAEMQFMESAQEDCSEIATFFKAAPDWGRHPGFLMIQADGSGPSR